MGQIEAIFYVDHFQNDFWGFHKSPFQIHWILNMMHTWLASLEQNRTRDVTQLFVCFIRYSEILSDLLSILFKLLLGKYLYAYIMDAPISLAIFTIIFWHRHLDPLIQHVCECTQSSINPSKLSFRLRRHFEHELVLDQTICRRLLLWYIQLIHPWSERLLLILCCGNHNSFLFKLWIIQMIP